MTMTPCLPAPPDVAFVQRSRGLGNRRRRRASLHLALVAALTTTACSDGSIARFDVAQDVPQTRVPGSAAAAVLPGAIATIPLDVTAEESFQREDYAYVQSIRMNQLTLTIASASEDRSGDALEDGRPDNFDFLDSLTILIQAELGDGERAEVIASLPEGDAQLSGGARQISLVTSNIDISSYVDAPGGYRIQVSGTGSVPPDDVVFTGRANYRVGVGLF